MKIKITKGIIKLRLKRYRHVTHALRITFWFLTGAALSLFFVSSFALLAYQKLYDNKIYPGVYVNNINFGGKNKQDIEKFFSYKNSLIGNATFVLTSDYGIASISAKAIDLGYNQKLLADQAYTVGRSGGILSNLSLILQAYVSGIHLPATYAHNQNKLLSLINPISEKIERKPVDALFKFENNRVTVFRPSSLGQTIDINSLNDKISSQTLTVVSSRNSQVIIIPIPIKTIQPEVTTDKANNLGIKELIGEGHSLFYHSIPSRIYNINLAATRIN